MNIISICRVILFLFIRAVELSIPTFVDRTREVRVDFGAWTHKNKNVDDIMWL